MVGHLSGANTTKGYTKRCDSKTEKNIKKTFFRDSGPMVTNSEHFSLLREGTGRKERLLKEQKLGVNVTPTAGALFRATVR
eukprot:scaffold114071_cov20-Attheya_sp.AAC.1